MRSVEVKMQSENWHSLRQLQFWIVRVAVGQLEGVCCAVTRDRAVRLRAARSFIFLLCDLAKEVKSAANEAGRLLPDWTWGPD